MLGRRGEGSGREASYVCVQHLFLVRTFSVCLEWRRFSVPSHPARKEQVDKENMRQDAAMCISGDDDEQKSACEDEGEDNNEWSAVVTMMTMLTIRETPR